MSMSRLAGFIRPGYNPLKVPNPPTIGTPTAGNTQVSVAFTAPSDIGGGAISSYTAVSTPGGFTASAASSPIVVTGLTNGTAYTFTVLATNAYGPSAISAASSSVTPVPPSWMATFGDAPASGAGNDVTYGLYVDSSSNVYVAGEAITSGTLYATLTKYNFAGVIQWQYRYGASTGVITAMTADSSGNIFATAYVGGVYRLYKLDSSGAFQWQKSLSNGSAYGVKVDGSGNIYVQYDGTSSYPILSQITSTGATVNWTRQVSSSGPQFQYSSLAVTSAGVSYLVGRSESANNILALKYDSSGAIVWKRRTTFNGGGTYGTGVAIDSSENVYVFGNYGTGAPQSVLYKLDSSGNYVWGVTIAQCYGGVIAIDSTGSNVYLSGQIQSGNKQYLMKFNSSGTIQWQRTMTLDYSYPGGSTVAGLNASPALDSTFVYFAITAQLGASPGGKEWFIEKLPLDGSKTGTYTVGGFSVTYATSSYTIGSQADNFTTSSYADATSTVTTTTTTDAVTATSITSSTTTL